MAPGALIRTAAAGLLLAASLLTAGTAAAGTGCPGVGGNWSAAGPFAVTSASTGHGTTIFRPTALGTLGCTRHPVILWSNGAAATVDNYAALLTHFASHGFIVAAAEGRSGDAAPVLAGLDYLTTENSTAGSVYSGRVDLGKVGATGHSLGGGAAVGAGADPRVSTVAPMFGGPFNDPAKLHGPALFFAGQLDLVVWPSVVHDRYQKASQVPAIYAELAGGNHFSAKDLLGPATAWFRYQLMGDEQARPMFFGPNCGYCTAPLWSAFERNPKAGG